MKIVAVTACPTGVAHTYMAQEALERASRLRGHEIKVETQGAMGIENAITPEEVLAADVVIFGVGLAVEDENRFAGKPIVKFDVGDVIRHADRAVIRAEELYEEAK